MYFKAVFPYRTSPCMLIQVSPPCLLKFKNTWRVYRCIWVSMRKYTHTNQYYLICTFPAKNFRSIPSSWNSDWGSGIEYNKWPTIWGLFRWIICSFCFPTRGSQIKQKRWFFTGQVSNLCNSLWKGVEVTISCDFKGRLEKFLEVASTEGS